MVAHVRPVEFWKQQYLLHWIRFWVSEELQRKRFGETWENIHKSQRRTVACRVFNDSFRCCLVRFLSFKLYVRLQVSRVRSPGVCCMLMDTRRISAPGRYERCVLFQHLAQSYAVQHCRHAVGCRRQMRNYSPISFVSGPDYVQLTCVTDISCIIQHRTIYAVTGCSEDRFCSVQVNWNTAVLHQLVLLFNIYIYDALVVMSSHLAYGSNTHSFPRGCLGWPWPPRISCPSGP